MDTDALLHQRAKRLDVNSEIEVKCTYSFVLLMTAQHNYIMNMMYVPIGFSLHDCAKRGQ